MYDTSGVDTRAKVSLEDEGRCCCTELLFGQADPDCTSQVIQTVYQGRRADFVLRIFGDDKEGYYLEMEAYSGSGITLDMVPEDLIEIHRTFEKIREKYDLAARPPDCEIKPYYRHQKYLGGKTLCLLRPA